MTRRARARRPWVILGAACMAAVAEPAAGQAASASAPAAGRESDVELAKKLANPVADLISLPFQFNYDCCYGPEDAGRTTLNIQPVVPVHLTDNLNLIIRTIVPVISQQETVAGTRDQLGLGDILQTWFLSPKTEGVTLAAGPAILYPSGTDGFSQHKWSAGPAALVLKQHGHMTYGLLATQVWSFAGSERAGDVNTTMLQPFFNYTFPNTTGILANLESSYDWERKDWTVPMNVGVTHIYKVGEQRIQGGIMGRYYLDKPGGGPDWGVRLVVTFLIPS